MGMTSWLIISAIILLVLFLLVGLGGGRMPQSRRRGGP